MVPFSISREGLAPTTTLCISVASRPGKLGLAMHTAGYRALGLDYAYQPYGADDIAAVIHAVRAAGVRGCSVSMPFKQAVMAHLDRLTPVAAAVGAVNTVVNEAGKLMGTNTDALGFLALMRGRDLPLDTPILLVGAGGVARAIAWALHELGFSNVTITARRAALAKELAATFAATAIDWQEMHRFPSQMLINATPIGMAPDADAVPVELTSFPTVQWVADVVVNPVETVLIRQARQRGCQVITGADLTLEQALAQFECYTGQQAPRQAMAAALAAAMQNK